MATGLHCCVFAWSTCCIYDRVWAPLSYPCKITCCIQLVLVCVGSAKGVTCSLWSSADDLHMAGSTLDGGYSDATCVHHSDALVRIIHDHWKLESGHIRWTARHHASGSGQQGCNAQPPTHADHHARQAAQAGGRQGDALHQPKNVVQGHGLPGSQVLP